MRYIYTLILIIHSLNIFSQKDIFKEIEDLNGIWIAEDYYKSFEKTKSVIKSKKSFNHSIPVGLRINSSEIENDILNVGCSYLHDHGIHPEVSKYIIIEGDTIREQYCFDIDLSLKDSLNNFIAKGVFYHAFDFTVSFSWTSNPDTCIILHNPNVGTLSGGVIKFKRVSSSFDKNYQFPNPLYYYIRSRTLFGNFILKDSLDNILSDEFSIHLDGTSEGFSYFDDKTFYYSTDIYCGPTVEDDYIIINDKKGNFIKGFIFEMDGETIYLYNSEWIFDSEVEKRIKKELVYKLIRKTYQDQ